MIKHASGSFTRPADTTAYASGDLIANSTTAGSVVAPEITGVSAVPGGEVMLHRVGLRKSGTASTNANIRVHLFRADPTTVTNGDNGAISVSGAADYLGQWDVTTMQSFTDGCVGYATPINGLEVPIRLGPNTASLYALLEARAAYTPASAEVFTITLDVEAL